MKILYGTTNKAKLEVARRAVEGLDISIISLHDIDGAIPPIQECGRTPLENAEIKAKAYYEALKIPVFSCDSGLYFDEVTEEEQPGIYVRRVNGRELSDEEMIAYYSSLAGRYGGKITGRYRNAIYLVMDEDHCYSRMDESIATEPFLIVAVPHPKRVQGFPLDSLSVDIASGQYYYDLEPQKVSSSVELGMRDFFQESVVSNIKGEDNNGSDKTGQAIREVCRAGYGIQKGNGAE